MAEVKSEKKVEHLTINELLIINAIKNGKHTVAEISETINLKPHITGLIIGSLVNKQKAVVDNGTVRLLKEQTQSIRLSGNLSIPVSTFVDAQGQKWVVRGEWHKIPDDLDITTIDWFEKEIEENPIVGSLKKTRETKSRVAAAARAASLSEDGEALPEDKKLVGKYININEKWKMWVYNVSAKRASVEFSPRFFNSTVEFPHGSVTERTLISIEQCRELANGVQELPETLKFTLDMFSKKVPNTFPAAFVSDNTIKYYSAKPHEDGVKFIEYDLVIADRKKYNERSETIVEFSKVQDFLKEKCILFWNAVN